MSEEMVEIFRDMRERSQSKRENNRNKAQRILKERGINFVAHSDVHLTVTGKDKIIDFWPGTGKFIPRDQSKKHGRGIFNLIRQYC